MHPRQVLILQTTVVHPHSLQPAALAPPNLTLPPSMLNLPLEFYVLPMFSFLLEL